MTNSVTMGSSSKDLDYEVIHTPALKPIPLDPNEELVKISAIPNWAQSAFKEVIQFNRVQSKVYETALFKPDNILLCAPTGAGKSSVAVLTILQRIACHRNPDDGSIDHSAYKILYLVHAEALVVEVVRNLNNCLEEYDGIKIIKLSEEPSLTFQQIQDSQVIVTTPEKWDIVTRKIQHHRIYTQNMMLLIMDEIHLHNDVLESIIARTKMHAKESTRLVGLSANCFNYEDVAKFLHIEAKGLFTFNDAYRHIPISQFLFGIKGEVQCQLQTMNHLCYEKVMAVDKENQILIFVHSREEAAKMARGIIADAISNGTISRFRKEDSASHKILCTHTDIVMCNDLKYLLPYGFAIHNTNMSSEDCKVVEKLFAEGHLQVLVCDKDFAWGVNLLAHIVIVKGTQFYNPEKGAWTELSPLDVMQMLGRAGRPQRNSYCEGIIFTEHKELQYYHSLMKQQLPIESQFASKLADQLNAEVVLGSVQNVKEARHWIGYTYLYVCMLRDLNSYGLAPDILTSNITLEESKADLIHKAATLLDNSNLVKYDSKSGYLKVTDLGRIASYYNITHKTIFMYSERLKSTMEDKELCQLFSLSEEFKNVTVRQDEMTELTKLLDCVPIPIKESLKEPSAKINVLLQAYISQLKLEGLSMTSDMVFITQSAGRLLPALFEIALIRGWAQLAEKALNLCKMVAKRMWSVQTPLRQFNGIPSDILTKLEKKDLAWERYYDLSSQEIGELICAPKMGRTLHKFIHQIPKLNLAAHVQPITRTVLGVELRITPDFAWDDRIHGYVEPFWVIVEDNDGEYILHHEYFLLKKQYIEEDHTLNFTVPIYEPLPPQYFIRVVSDKWLGSQTVLPVSFRHLILPEKYPPPTEFLDLQPLPVTALRNPSYEALYQEFKHFNPVQTQVFPVLYNSDDNVLVASPTGSDKTICAEFAILRDHQTDHVMQIGNNGVMRVVYVSPIEALAKERYRDWKKKFGDGLQLNVVELTGRGATDLKLMNQGQIIVSTLEKWDALSRSSNDMMYAWGLTLFIIDGLHLIGRQRGVLETVVSRMRCIASQKEKLFKQKIRFVAFSTSLANAKNLGEWIGATSHGIFNFPLGNPLQIHIQEVNVANFEARMQAMTKPTYTAITQHAKNGKSVIVFVPTRKYVRLTAEDLIAYSGADSGEKPFLLKPIEDLEPLINNINDEMLKGTLHEGVGYLHEGLNHHDHNIVIQLFETGWIQVCIITSSLSWEVNLSSYSVIVMGTQYCDGLEDAQANYSFTDLLQMVGHVNHPLVENDCRECTIFCHAPRKEYYKTLLDGFTVESVLQDFFHDDLFAEVRGKYTFTMKKVMEYYLANSFMAKCLTSIHLKELIENTLEDLKTNKYLIVMVHYNMVDHTVYLTELGKIASNFCINYETVKRISESLTQTVGMKNLLDLLSKASEYDLLPIILGREEEERIGLLLDNQRFPCEHSRVRDPHLVANVLLQAHLSRLPVGANLVLAQRYVVVIAERLLQAIIAITCEQRSSDPTLICLAIAFNQMLIQALWEDESMLLQVPHLTKGMVLTCNERDILFLDQLFNISQFFEKYCRVPDLFRKVQDVDVSYEIIEITILFWIKKIVKLVHAPFYPTVQREKWWILVYRPEDGWFQLKSITGGKKNGVTLNLTAPNRPGRTRYVIYFMCSSYKGFNQSGDLNLDVEGDFLLIKEGDEIVKWFSLSFEERRKRKRIEGEQLLYDQRRTRTRTRSTSFLF